LSRIFSSKRELSKVLLLGDEEYDVSRFSVEVNKVVALKLIKTRRNLFKYMGNWLKEI